jgi:hypothetical protein
MAWPSSVGRDGPGAAAGEQTTPLATTASFASTRLLCWGRPICRCRYAGVCVLHHLLEHVLGQRLRRDALIAQMSGLNGFYVNARRAW